MEEFIKNDIEDLEAEISGLSVLVEQTGNEWYADELAWKREKLSWLQKRLEAQNERQ